MDFLELVKQRYSARDYLPKAVEQAKIDYILECARLAPSAVNRQPWRFIVVQSADGPAGSAAVLCPRLVCSGPLIPCYIRQIFRGLGAAWVRGYDQKNHADIDAAIAIEHICLAATEQKLGSCWVCNFDVDLLRRYFDMTSDEHPVAIIPIGYVNKEPLKPTSRKSLDELVTVK